MIRPQKNNYSIVFASIPSSQARHHQSPKNASKRHVLGQGGLGVVYAGTYQSQQVAIKTLYRADPKRVDALRREAMVMQYVSSPYTVTLLGMMEDGDSVSLVMERLGISLFQRIHQKGPFPWSERYRLAHEIAKGLGVLHQRGLVHGRITSQRVFLDASGHAKIISFSRVLEQDSENKPTTCPDIHAFGVILWELAARAIPRGPNNPMPKGCPHAFAQLIKACWEEQLEVSELIDRIQALSVSNQPCVSASWHVDQHLLPDRPDTKQTSPVLGDDVSRVEVLYTRNQERAFTIQPQSPQKSHAAWGQQVLQRFKNWAHEHKEPMVQNVNIQPIWCGTPVVDSCEIGDFPLHFVVRASDAQQAYNTRAFMTDRIAKGFIGTVLYGNLLPLNQCGPVHIMPVIPQYVYGVLVFHGAQCFGVTIQPVMPQAIRFQCFEPVCCIADRVSLFAAIKRMDIFWAQCCIHAGLAGEDLIFRGDHALTAALRCPTPDIFDCLLQWISLPERVQKDGKEYHLLNLLWTESSWPVEEKKYRIEVLMDHGLRFMHAIGSALCFGDADAQLIDGHQESTDALGYKPVHYLVIGGDLARIQSWCTLMPEARYQVTNHGATLLLLAAEKGHGPVVQWLLNTGMAQVDESTIHGETALLLAAKNGHLPVVQWLLHEGGARVDEEDDNGHTAVLLAAGRGHLPVIQWLCNQSWMHSHEHRQKYTGNTPLLLAAKNGYLPVIQWLLHSGFSQINERNDTNNVALGCAVKGGHLAVIQWLLKQDPSALTGKDSNGFSVLLLAAYYGHSSVVQWLLRKGLASLDEKNNDGDTALILAIKRGHLTLVQWMLTAGGATVKEKNNDRNLLHVAEKFRKSNILLWLIHEYEELILDEKDPLLINTVFLLSVKRGLIDTVKKLVRHCGADVHVKDKYGNTALVLSAQKGRLSIVRWLHESCGAVVDEKNEQGNTALMMAVQKNHFPVIKWLLESGGAMVDEKNYDGRTALLVAAQKNNLSLIQFLSEEWGASLHKRDKWGNTALLLAAKNGCLPMVQWLLTTGGAKADERDNHGHTALLLAALNDQLPVIQWLLKEGGAQVDEENYVGNTALLLAVKKNYFSTVQWLLYKGKACAYKKNKYGQGVFDSARFSKNKQLEFFFRSYFQKMKKQR